MNSNKQNLINKIKYRSLYRGTKEMDLFVNKFVNSVIKNLDFNQLKTLDELINLGDEDLIKISYQEIKKNENKVLILLKEFRKKY
jgi:antitoxin CptB